MKVNYKKLYEDAIEPTRGSDYAAGYDLYAHIEDGSVTIPAGENKKIGTGITMAIPNLEEFGLFGGIFARSGAANKRGLRPANCVGVVDSDYRGEFIVALYNDSDEAQTIHNGDRIAQLVIMPCIYAELNEVSDLDDTARGEGGFGSTGV